MRYKSIIFVKQLKYNFMITARFLKNSARVQQNLGSSVGVSKESSETIPDEELTAFNQMLNNLYQASSALRSADKKISDRCLNMRFGEDV